MTDLFLGSVASGLPRQLHFDNYQNFINAVQRNGGNNATTAGLIIQNLIINRLKKKVNVPGVSLEVKQTIAKRLKYFKSPDFIRNFMSDVPARDTWSKSISATSYSDWLNTLFNVSYGSWREEELIRPSNQQQCIGALDELGRDVSQLQATPPLRICYLCGRSIQPGEPTMECEHVLPVITALSHIWLAQERMATYTPEERKILRLEYAWSHKCCNRIKSNYEFIALNGTSYVVNQTLINQFSAAVDAAGDSYDCNQIVEVPKFLPNVHRPAMKNKLLPRITEIVQVINKNVANFANIDLYLLWTKYKILFALTDQSFLNAITGDGTIATATPVFRDPARIAAKRAREAQLAAEEAAFWEFKKEGPARREAKRLAAIAATAAATAAEAEASAEASTMSQGGGGGPNRLASSNIGLGHIDPNMFLDIFDEDVTFPTAFLTRIGGIDALPAFILSMPLPNLDHDLAAAMVPEPIQYINITSLTRLPGFGTMRYLQLKKAIQQHFPKRRLTQGRPYRHKQKHTQKHTQKRINQHTQKYTNRYTQKHTNRHTQTQTQLKP
jgi:hypothetical protein